MSRKFKACLSVGTVLLLGGSAFYIGRWFHTAVSRPVVPKTAFTAQWIGKTHAGNDSWVKTKYIYARRSDLSSAHLELDKPLGGLRKIVLLQEHEEITVADSLHMRSTIFLSPEAAEQRRQRTRNRGSIAGFTPVREGRFLQFRVIKLAREDKRTRMFMWNAPELGDYTVRRMTEFKTPDGRISDWYEETAESIIVGEPSASLFSIPEDYAEVKPSQLLGAAIQSRGGACPNSELFFQTTFGAMDKIYFDSRKFRPSQPACGISTKG